MVLQSPKNNQKQANTNTIVSRTFESTRLGIRFTYASQDLGKKILVQEIGDTIYVYPEGTKIEDGQYVRVFTKDPNITLKTTVENKFLVGYDKEKCYVQAGTDANQTVPEKGIAAIIAFPVSSDVNTGGLENATNCPAGYRLTNGISYFWTDKDNSDKFVFFSIGQYYIPSTTEGTSWHTTLEFI